MRKVYHNIIHIAGNVITVEADNVAYNELAEVTGSRGTSLAQVIRLDRGKVALQVFAGSRGVSTQDQVRFLGREMQVSKSPALLGRVFNGRGAARDHKPDITDSMTDIGTPSVNPAKRVIPKNMIRTNIPMIDVSSLRSCRFFPSPESPTTSCLPASLCRLRSMSSSSEAWDSNTMTTSF